MDATLSLGNDSVAIPLVEESGTPLVATSLGKNNVDLPNSGGSLFPRSLDNWSGLQNITLVGRFTDANAYQDARDLIDLVESDFGNDELRLDLPLPEYDDSILVALSAGQEGACSVSYEPGHRNNVRVDLSLSRISRVDGTGNRTARTPTDTGTGPVELRVQGTTVGLGTNLTLERSCGRPNDVIRRQPQSDYPYYINKPKTITETIAVDFELVDNPVQKLQDIGSALFQANLGRDSATLDFNGVYGLGEFSVLPVGSAPFRQVRRAGYKNQSRVPTAEFVRVFNKT